MPRRFTAALLALAAALAACQPAPPPKKKSCDVGIVGDSLTVGVRDYTTPPVGQIFAEKGCRIAWIEAKGGQPTPWGVERLRARAASGQLPYVLIVGLGTNDTYHLSSFDANVAEVMRLANGRQVIWLNIARNHRGHHVAEHVNRVLADRARRHKNLSIIDWHSAFWNNASYRQNGEPGGPVHATRAGYTHRARLMADRAWSVTK